MQDLSRQATRYPQTHGVNKPPHRELPTDTDAARLSPSLDDVQVIFETLSYHSLQLPLEMLPHTLASAVGTFQRFRVPSDDGLIFKENSPLTVCSHKSHRGVHLVEVWIGMSWPVCGWLASTIWSKISSSISCFFPSILK